MIGASIRYGRLNEKLYQFIQRHVTTLTNSKAAFFCVNLTARKEDQGKDTPEGSVYIQTFLKSHRGNQSVLPYLLGHCITRVTVGSTK